MNLLGTLLFFVASDNVKANSKSPWLQEMAQKPAFAKTAGTVIFLVCWAVVIYLQGLGSGTFAMLGYLMTSYCLVVLLNPLRYFNTIRLAVVALITFLLEIFIF